MGELSQQILKIVRSRNAKSQRGTKEDMPQPYAHLGPLLAGGHSYPIARL